MTFKGNSLKISLVMFVLSCTFIGHRDCPDEIEEKLYETVECLIIKNGVKNFYVGTQGKFDYIVYRVLADLKSKYNIEIYVVLAYLDEKKKYYNEKFTVFPEILETIPKRYAIIKRNKYMINKSQFLVSYVNNSFTNAYIFMKGAIDKNLKIINIGKYNPPI